MKNQLTREFQLTLEQHINERIPITVIFGDLKSECTIIKGADIGLNNDGQAELGFNLAIYEAEGKATLFNVDSIEIFIGEYKITYNTQWIKYSLEYWSFVERYELNIPIAECELIKLGEEANGK